MEIKISIKYFPGLIKNGYKKIWVNSYVKKSAQGRIHCQLVGDYMYFHFDNCQNWYHKIGRGWKNQKFLEKEVAKIKNNFKN